MLKDLGVRGQQRESLIDDLMIAAKRSHFAIPTQTSEAAVLNECRRLFMMRDHLFELTQRHVAHAEGARVTSLAFANHCSPHFSVGIAPATTGRRTMQNVAIDVIGSK